LHGGDSQILYITRHDAVNGYFGNTGFLCQGGILPVQVVFAKVTPFAPAFNAHSQKVGTVTGSSDVGAADAYIIGLLF
jgi:hypothetical protein